MCCPVLCLFSYLEKVALLQEVADSLCARHFALVTLFVSSSLHLAQCNPHVMSCAHAAHTALLTRFSYVEKLAFLQEIDALFTITSL
jgi:hypothetical protein